MNILVIGNGFDLAHNLPTKYSDFLKFTAFLTNMKQKEQHDNWLDVESIDLRVSEAVQKAASDAEEWIEDAYSLTENNKWLEMFCSIQEDKGWVDFESEISTIIQSLDTVLKIATKASKTGDEVTIRPEAFDKRIIERVIGRTYQKWTPQEVFEWKRILLSDLNRMTECLEIYLAKVISKMPVEALDVISSMKDVAAILSFNYTNTYERIYDVNRSKKYCYIHGQIRDDLKKGLCDMVLGSHEYLSEEENDDIECIEFKKYFQRIHKHTGCEYKTWVDINKRMGESAGPNPGAFLREHPNGLTSAPKVFFYGHSLDITDGDIIRELVLPEGNITEVFYLDQRDYADKIKNLVRVLTRDEVIARTGNAIYSLQFSHI